jgi:hypothetical protein
VLVPVEQKGLAGVGRINISTAAGRNGNGALFRGRHISGRETRIRTVKSTSTDGNTATEAMTNVDVCLNVWPLWTNILSNS